MIRRFIPVLVLSVAAIAVTGCGKKPSFVDPPQGREADRFPHTYPKPAAKTPSDNNQSGSGFRFP